MSVTSVTLRPKQVIDDLARTVLPRIESIVGVQNAEISGGWPRST